MKNPERSISSAWFCVLLCCASAYAWASLVMVQLKVVVVLVVVEKEQKMLVWLCSCLSCARKKSKRRARDWERPWVATRQRKGFVVELWKENVSEPLCSCGNQLWLSFQLSYSTKSQTLLVKHEGNFALREFSLMPLSRGLGHRRKNGNGKVLWDLWIWLWSFPVMTGQGLKWGYLPFLFRDVFLLENHPCT